jgi:hypothetical protein
MSLKFSHYVNISQHDIFMKRPPPSPGMEFSGTKPDCFDAIIARNFYWLNVARFYADVMTWGAPFLLNRPFGRINRFRRLLLY